ncbi:MAG: MFS transporter [Ignavibacteriales bacterium]|nr:MFS transporter [Ignavibacteriales bacterium]
MKSRSPWSWIPSLYFAQGLPYVSVMTISVIMYKRMGISNTDIALYTSYLYLPWVIKPLWSPFIDLFRTKRFWTVWMQFVIGLALAGIALAIPLPSFFQYTIAVFWLMAFASATHDIAADGLYMLSLPQHQQAAFNGVRSTFYRIAMIAGQGVLVVVAGELEKTRGIPAAWSLAFFILAGLFLMFFAYHKFMLPVPSADHPASRSEGRSVMAEFFRTFALFFKKPGIGAIFAFLLLFRFAEAQLVKLVSPFLLDARAQGGLGLTTAEVGIAYGTVGVAALLTGGILGGLAIARFGLKRMIWIQVLAIHLPDLMFVYLSHVLPENYSIICSAIAVEQFGYGFGFAAYMMFMIMTAEGEYKTAHYAICTGFMALGMMIPGMWSGWLQDKIGYANFFVWVIVSTIPGFIVPALVKIDPEFGKKKII